MWVPQKTFCPHVTSSVPNVVRGSKDVAIQLLPVGCMVSVEYASSNAPRPLTSPAPCVNESYSTPASSCSRVALYCSIALMALGVGYGGGTHCPELIYLALYSAFARS